MVFLLGRDTFQHLPDCYTSLIQAAFILAAEADLAAGIGAAASRIGADFHIGKCILNGRQLFGKMTFRHIDFHLNAFERGVPKIIKDRVEL